ncbi:NUDIX domain-containing protein [Tepidicaulis sp.]|uniref:NUDIX domain-containing protein n=1 Tax=Tepidicaulis sp. TaxID=1920809 RepID=UPI003B5B5726
MERGATHAIAVKAHIWRAGKLLILKRQENDEEYGGYWDIPGGRLLPGEDARQGLTREVREETGLAPQKIRPLTVWDYEAGGTKVVGLSFLARTEEERVRLSAEHSAYAWMAPEEMSAYRFAANLEKEISWIIEKGWHL